MGNLSNLSNIELFNKRYKDRTLDTTVPDDQVIVETVVVDIAAIIEHADILYKHYAGARASGSSSGYVAGWRPVSYKCKYCNKKATRSYENFIDHLVVCDGLDD